MQRYIQERVFLDIGIHSDLDQTSDISILENAENNGDSPEVRKLPVQKLENAPPNYSKSTIRHEIRMTD